MIGSVIKGCAYGWLAITIGWSTAAIGNGKIATLFGRSVFIAAGEDMKIALFLNAVAVIAFLILMAMAIMARAKRGKNNDYANANPQYAGYYAYPWYQPAGISEEDESRRNAVD